MKKKFTEMNEKECLDFMESLKWAGLSEWLKKKAADPEATAATAKEVEARTGLKQGSYENQIATAFFCGMDAGVNTGVNLSTDILLEFKEAKEKSPACREVQTGQATD